MTKYPRHLITLIEFFKKLPGVGQRSAERFAFHILDWPEETLQQFGNTIQKTTSEIQFCNQCHAMASEKKCLYCSDTGRSTDQLCVVALPKDIFAIEDSHSYRGLYHVLGGVLSPTAGFDPHHLNVDSLLSRIQKLQVKEVILAFDSTVEGDATTLFLKKKLSPHSLNVSRLAFGIPVGSSLEYIDSSTLSRAFVGRQGF